jgi:L-idonate 5-dehydrogenase
VTTATVRALAVRVAYGGIDGSDLHYWRHVRYLGSAPHLPHVQGGLTDVLGARVLVTGAGPIGLLVVAALRRAGAAEIVVTDVAPEPLERAAAVGAHRTADLTGGAAAGATP